MRERRKGEKKKRLIDGINETRVRMAKNVAGGVVLDASAENDSTEDS